MTERDVFVAAFGRQDSADRAAYLAEACGQDAALRARVERLLALAADADPFLDPRAEARPPALAAGDVVAGRYLLLDLFGEGAMGAVWRAEQSAPLRREVALKVLHPEHAAGPVAARFEAERHVLGRMDHPNIAAVFDAGTTADGRPFFALEAVRGPSVARYCSERGLGVVARLELFVPVCRAVHHAHQKGVVHRDIKPSNVLIADVDGRPVPKVIDFGVAKAVAADPAAARLTGHGALVGTPQYMSPEQAELDNPDIDTRTDVYSLGAVLYELLTGAPPVHPDRLKAEPLLDVLRAVREEEPARPSIRGGGGVPPARWRELDAVVLTCLAKNRDRRYASAAALADDLDRFLADEPVAACRPSRRDRAARFVRRNRGAVLFVAVALVLLVGGTVGTTVGLVRADRAARAEATQRAAAERDRDEKDRAVREADALLQTARRALGHVNQRAATFAFEPRMEKEWRELMSGLTRAYEELHAARAADPAIRAEMGQTFVRMGASSRRLGDTSAALRALGRGIELLEELAAESALPPPARDLLIRAYQHQGWELSAAGRRPERVVAHRRALEHADRLAAASPDPGHRDLLADCHIVLGTTMAPTNPDEAGPLFRRAAELLAAPGSNQLFLGTAWLALGELQRDQPDRRADAEVSLRRAVEILSASAGRSPRAWQTHDRLADARVQLGRVLAADGRAVDAVGQLREALAVREKQAADFPDVRSYRDDLTVARVELIRVLSTLGRQHEARALFACLSPQPPDSPAACSTLACLLAGCPDPALRDPQRAVSLAERAVAHAPEFAFHWRALGVARYRAGRHGPAIEALTEALGQRPAGSGTEQFYLALANLQQGRRDVARKWYEDGAAWRARYAPRDADLARLRDEAAAALGIVP